MNNLLFTLGSFLIVFFIHIIFHRFFLKVRKNSVFVVSLYIVGLVFVIVHLFSTRTPDLYALRFVPILLYVFCTLFFFLFYFTVNLEGKTPSREILSAFQTKPQQKKSEILDLFTEKSLIDIRLLTLQKKGFVKERKGRYIVTRKGQGIGLLLSLYTRMFGVEVGG